MYTNKTGCLTNRNVTFTSVIKDPCLGHIAETIWKINNTFNSSALCVSSTFLK